MDQKQVVAHARLQERLAPNVSFARGAMEMVEPHQEPAITRLEHVQVQDVDSSDGLSFRRRINCQPPGCQRRIYRSPFERSQVGPFRARKPWRKQNEKQNAAESPHRKSEAFYSTTHRPPRLPSTSMSFPASTSLKN